MPTSPYYTFWLKRAQGDLDAHRQIIPAPENADIYAWALERLVELRDEWQSRLHAAMAAEQAGALTAFSAAT